MFEFPEDYKRRKLSIARVKGKDFIPSKSSKLWILFKKKHSVTFSKIYINVLSFSCNLDKIHFLSPLTRIQMHFIDTTQNNYMLN
jgi:hypothetical protein